MKASLNVLGIYREEIFSNRAVSADRAILDDVLKEFELNLGEKVFITKIRPEDKVFRYLDYEWDLIFSMAQDSKILTCLDILETKGRVVVNSGRGIRNCYRGKLSEIMITEGFSYPRYIPLKVDQDIVAAFYSEHGYWVKRGDYHALVDEDVTHIDSLNDLHPILSEFRERGVDKVILQENCQGELFKFYGVLDNFFSLRYMGKTTKDRYSFIAGNPNVIFDREHLERLVHKAARALELDFFGGDCIITESGEMHFIDFNDWPSFRTCRKEVAPIMASYAINKLKSEAAVACSSI
ncbi:MAG: hypothetical protein EHM20_04725 [Alphaproteobacteria bacterium]|nr:MAG: hypothetical protein EHM20_04725 [Alphaproteobacteria bacterium]